MMNDALSHIRVLDLTTTYSGPHCARLLADVGADVIKIEPPGGEVMRHAPPLRNGASSSFGQLNSGKRSLVLDLKQRAGIDILRRMVGTADVLVENYRPGVMARFGLDYDSLRAVKPDLIYCAISGYGQTGPSAGLAAYAPAIQAASGYELAQLSHQGGRERPDAIGVYPADLVAGTYAFGAVMTALMVRERTGAGQMIDVSMLEGTLGLLLPELQRAQFESGPVTPLFPALAAKDGYLVVVIGSERVFQNTARAIRREEWLSDPRFASITGRREHWSELVAGLEAWASTRTVAECQAALDHHGVPASRFRTAAEAMADPQIAHRGALAEIADAGGTFKAVNPPFRFSAARAHCGPRVSSLGEDTRAVLREAGYAEAEIDDFLATGAAL